MMLEIQKLGDLEYKFLVSFPEGSIPVYGFDLSNLKILGGVIEDVYIATTELGIVRQFQITNQSLIFRAPLFTALTYLNYKAIF